MAAPGAPVAKVRRIFVSYRRSDTGGHVGLLVTRLRHQLGRRAVFCDVDEIQRGDRFEATIAREIARCAVIFIVIGPDWLSATSEEGATPRIHQEGDVVRQEVVSALASGATVVPVLVGGGKRPAPGQLPSELVPLLGLDMCTFSQSSGRKWEEEVAGLVRDIRTPWRAASPPRGGPELLSAVQSALLVAAVAMLAATVLRGIAPMYLFVESTLMAIVSVLAAAAALAVWNSWHPGPRRGLSPRISLSLLAALPLLWSSYRWFRPVVLTAAEGRTASIKCSDEYFVQAYRRSLPLWQPTTDAKDGNECKREFNGRFQRVTLRSGLAHWGDINLHVEVADGLGRIEALRGPKANRPDLHLGVDPLPPAMENVSLPYRGGDVFLFRLESSVESVQALATLTSPFWWVAGRESLDVTLFPRNSDSPR